MEFSNNDGLQYDNKVDDNNYYFILYFIKTWYSQEKKLKNLYIQEHTTGTTFEPKFKKKTRYEDEYRQWWFSNAKSSTISE